MPACLWLYSVTSSNLNVTPPGATRNRSKQVSNLSLGGGGQPSFIVILVSWHIQLQTFLQAVCSINRLKLHQCGAHRVCRRPRKYGTIAYSIWHEHSSWDILFVCWARSSIVISQELWNCTWTVQDLTPWKILEIVLKKWRFPRILKDLCPVVWIRNQ